MSRSHDSMYAVAALLEKAGVTVQPGRARHRADRIEWRDASDTAVFPAVDAPTWPTTDVDRDDVAGPAHDDAISLDELAHDMARWGAEVERVTGREPSGDCEHCQVEGSPAEITVYSSAPLPGAERDMDEMCRNCTTETVAALRGRFGLDVLVEIPAVTA